MARLAPDDGGSYGRVGGTSPLVGSSSPSAPASSPSAPAGGASAPAGSTSSGAPVVSQFHSGPQGGRSVFEFELRTDAAHNPIQLPSYVPGSLDIEIYPLPTNTDNVFVAEGPSQAKNQGIRKIINPTAAGAVQYSVESLGRLFLFSNVVGEGVTVRVRS